MYSISTIVVTMKTYCSVNPMEQMMMVKQSGKYLKAYVANGVAPEYKQKSYGKYKLSKLLIYCI